MVHEIVCAYHNVFKVPLKDDPQATRFIGSIGHNINNLNDLRYYYPQKLP